MASSKTAKNKSYGRFSEPRRGEIVHVNSPGWFKVGQFGYVVSWDKRGGCHWIDRDGMSPVGTKAYLVQKTKAGGGGALWFSSTGVRFTKPVVRKTK
jgi:hypothetical protein